MADDDKATESKATENKASENRAAQQSAVAGSRVDAGTKTEHGPLGKMAAPRDGAKPKVVARTAAGAASAVVVGGFIGLIGSLLVLGIIADGVRGQEVFVLDTWATPFLHSISSPLLDTVMTGLTTMASLVVLAPIVVIVLGGLVLTRRYGAALFFTVATAGAAIIDATMKVIFERPRPKLDYASVLPDYSFPSGHSMNGVVFYVSLALIAWSIFGRRVGVPAIVAAAILAVGIGTSRIYLGYHYFTDVVGGFLAGIAWLLIVLAAFRARPKWWQWQTPRSRRVNAASGGTDAGSAKAGSAKARSAKAGSAHARSPKAGTGKMRRSP